MIFDVLIIVATFAVGYFVGFLFYHFLVYASLKVLNNDLSEMVDKLNRVLGVKK